MGVKEYRFFALQVSISLLAFAQNPNNYNAKGWKAASRFVSEYMDRRASPCVDIDHFMCGQFGDASDSEAYQVFYDEKTRKVFESFRTALESYDPKNRSVPHYARRLRSFFDECSKAQDDPSTMHEAYDILKDALGEYPPFEPAKPPKPKEESIWFWMGRMQQRLGKFLAIQAKFSFDSIAFEADIPTQDFQLDYIRNQTLRAAHFLQIPIDLKALDALLLESKQLYADWKEKAAAARASSSVDAPTPSTNLSAAAPGIDWDSYMRGLLTQNLAVRLKWMKKDLKFVIPEPAVMRQIGIVFKRHSVAAAKVLIYGRAFQTLMEDYINELESSLGQTWLAQQYIFRNKTMTRILRCLAFVAEAAPAASARLYFDYLGEDLLHWRNEVQMIANNVFSAMRLLLSSISYLSVASKERINVKIDAITLQPAIPTWIMDDNKLWANEAGYNGSQSFFMNRVQKAREIFSRDLKQYINAVEARASELEQPEPPPTFEQNSGYLGGNIKIYLGYILPPVFHVRYPLAVKYGFLGALIGHELMHGFDSMGIREEQPIPVKLLADNEFQIYDRHARCLNEQYSQYCFHKLGQCLVAENAIRDNIADISGLKVAYAAYQMAKEVLGEEPPLPGLEKFSSDQIFFMTYERGFCTRNSPDAFWITADHTPDKVRGPVALRNNPHFAVAFNCSTGSPAAPVKPCELWGDILSNRRR